MICSNRTTKSSIPFSKWLGYNSPRSWLKLETSGYLVRILGSGGDLKVETHRIGRETGVLSGSK
jgi:hypothetical protein